MAEKVKKTKAPAKPRATAGTTKKTVAKKQTVAEKVIATTPTHEEIARLAQQYWAERGRQDGQDQAGLAAGRTGIDADGIVRFRRAIDAGLQVFRGSRGRLGSSEAMKRILGRVAVGLIAALSVLYVGDWAVWRARVAMGGGMGTVP